MPRVNNWYQNTEENDLALRRPDPSAPASRKRPTARKV